MKPKPIRRKEEIDASLKMIEEMHKQVMSDDVYHKCVVSLAYEYLMAGEQQEGLRQIMRVPVGYYQDVQLKQMRDDEMYRDLVVLLSYRLIQLGVVEGADRVIEPNIFTQQGRA